ncbi:VOC family protein [Sulfitobacter delicatus]|uniref:VOC domain-containing protein n=1 Tax=Sulfitobacter delicatus TaxID=218672 RepID=A0A1G7X5W0_9RHOB|nr:VOC family protein [Sulfitobacter delicatus]SDG79608.1 hypothetical protein SAMN04489759_11211 [Sulfitobacter delicatus]
MPKPCPVVHFEMPYRDAARAAKFYEAAFGWQTQKMGSDMGDYVLLETTETKDSRPTTPGEINGGLFPYKEDYPSQVPLVVISVEGIDAAIERVTQAGGRVFGEPAELPGIGRYVAFQDCEGNGAAMLQPQM